MYVTSVGAGTWIVLRGADGTEVRVQVSPYRQGTNGVRVTIDAPKHVQISKQEEAAVEDISLICPSCGVDIRAVRQQRAVKGGVCGRKGGV